MAGISQSGLFASLGAPLSNRRWSWGAVRPSDGAVFLRVWQDSVETRDGRQFVWIGNERLRADPHNPGGRERMDHVRLLAAGRPCFLIMCRARDPKAETREIKDFIRDEVFPGGRVLQEGNQWWVEVLQRVPVREAMMPKSLPHVELF